MKAEEPTVARVGAKAQVDLLWNTSDCSTICAADGSKIDRCLIDNYFLKILS